jgi:hypothetical protein
MLCQFTFQRCDQFSRPLVDRALAAEMVLMLGDGQHALARDIPSPQHVFEKRNHIFGRLWSTEGDHKNCVIVHAFSSKMSCGYLMKKSS